MTSNYEDEAAELAAEADEATRDVTPDDEGEIGDFDDHVGRGMEEDPGEDPID